MTDSQNIPQSDPRADAPGLLAYELPPSPEQLAEQLRLSKIPLDLRVPWGWKDVALFVLVYLVSIILMGTVAALVAARIQHLDLNSLLKTPTILYIDLTIVAQTAASVVAMLYLFLMTRIRDAGDFWPALGWHSLNGTHTNPGTVLRYSLGGVALAAAASVSSLFLKHNGSTPIEEMFKARQTVLMLMAFGILVAPLVEETIFRGFLYPVAARSFGIVPGVLFTGILFGASHVTNLGGALAQIAVLIGVGIVLTWVRARTGSVLASFLLHVAYNSTLFAATFVGTHGFRDFPVGK